MGTPHLEKTGGSQPKRLFGFWSKLKQPGRSGAAPSPRRNATCTHLVTPQRPSSSRPPQARGGPRLRGRRWAGREYPGQLSPGLRPWVWADSRGTHRLSPVAMSSSSRCGPIVPRLGEVGAALLREARDPCSAPAPSGSSSLSCGRTHKAFGWAGGGGAALARGSACLVAPGGSGARAARGGAGGRPAASGRKSAPRRRRGV